MLKLRSLKFCLFALLTVLLCLAASPSLAGFPTTAPLVQSTQNPATRAERLEQQGRSHYTAGQFTEARVAFEQAAQAYATQGKPLKQAIALSNLSLTYQQLGQWAAATQAIAESLRLLDIKPNGNVQRQALAQVLDIQGRLYLLQGNGQAAFETWEQAAALYQQLGEQAQITENQINQAQALQTLGLYRRAIQILVTALGWEPQTTTDLDALNAQLQTLEASPTAIAALQSLGEALRVTGNLEFSRQMLQQSLEMAQRLQQPKAVATAQFKLGNLIWAEALINLSRSSLRVAEAAELIRRAKQGDRRIGIEQAEQFNAATDQVLQLYRQAAIASTIQLPAQLNQLRVLIETERRVDANQLLPSVQQLVSSLPIGHGAIEARINLAQSLVKLNSKGASEEQLTPSLPSPEEIAQLLTVTIQQAKELQDPRAESYALGYLGELYEKTGQLQEAQQMTRQALRLAKGHNASDIAYRWQWQLGRLLKAEADVAGNSKTYTEAIAAYTEATKTLQSIRSDLIAITAEEQLSFRDAIEPIYRELITLLLQSQSNTPDTQNLITAREVIESLQLAELNNFFREACLNGNPASIDQVDPSAAVVYPIILPDQLAVIISLPQQSSPSNLRQTRLDYYTVPVSQKELETTVNLLRDSLDQANDYRFLPPAKQLYNWLIRPIQDQLEANQVSTLVFVLDGVLRNIPMSVLHDGQQYLVEKPYSVAVTPGLQLLGTQPLAQKQLRSALLAGITIARPGFSALPSVKNELAQIQAEIPNTTTLLDRGASPSNSELTVDRAFTNANFQTAIAAGAFPIVHLATHGQFSSQLEETYILTEDGRLNVEDLRSSLRTTAVRQDSVLELLVLSACETAKGDNQAALGLAGIAIRAGARSTVATLWQVNDYSSAVFMGEFYRELVNVRALQTTKAGALQQAQRSLLQNPDYKHPYFWAPYVLIGNWQ
jgi:CHAT domain-containing protein